MKERLDSLGEGGVNVEVRGGQREVDRDELVGRTLLVSL